MSPMAAMCHFLSENMGNGHYMRTCGYFGIDTYDPQVGIYSHILCFD